MENENSGWPSARVCAVLLAACVVVQAQTNELAQKSKDANGMMAQGQYEKAIPLYRQLVKAVPGNPGLVLDLGLALHMAGHPKEAIPEFEAVLKTQPHSVPALTSLAACRLEINQPALAISPLQQLIALDPTKTDNRGMLAGAFMGVERFAEAAEQFRKIVSADAQDARAWFGLGRAYESLAAEDFSRLEKLAPESAYLLELIGDSQATRGQFRSAFYFYRQAESKQPQLPGLHYGLAKVYEQSGHQDWARSEMEREAHLPISDCGHHARQCSVLTGRYLEAVNSAASSAEDLFWSIKAYNQLALAAFSQLGHLPDSPEIHGLKASLFQQHRQYKESATEWKLALEMDPNNKELRRQWEAALFQSQDYETLLPMLREDIASEPGSPEGNYQLGECLLQLQQAEKALPYLQKASRDAPRFEPAHASLGLALIQLGRAQEAIPELERGLKLDDTGRLHYQLSRAYQAAGLSSKANAALAEYQSIQKRNQQQDETLNKEAQISAPL